MPHTAHSPRIHTRYITMSSFGTSSGSWLQSHTWPSTVNSLGICASTQSSVGMYIIYRGIIRPAVFGHTTTNRTDPEYTIILYPKCIFVRFTMVKAYTTPAHVISFYTVRKLTDDHLKPSVVMSCDRYFPVFDNNNNSVNIKWKYIHKTDNTLYYNLYSV